MHFLEAQILLVVTLIGSAYGQCTAVGETVTIMGFIMDNFCIDRGTLLDNPSVATLENPEVHTIHCLIDVRQCVDSLYAVLEPPSSPGGLYSVAYQLGQEGSDLAFKAAEEQRALGQTAGLKLGMTGIDDGSGFLQCITLTGEVEAGTDTGGSLNGPALRAAHGSLMFISWMILVPAGIIIARHFKHIGHNWYRMHLGLQMTSAVLVFIAVVLIFLTSSALTSTDGLVATHAWLGILVAALGVVVQPVLGKLADIWFNPDRQETPFFPDRLHAWLGRFLLLSASVNVWLGFFVLNSSLGAWIVCGVLANLATICAFAYYETRFSNGNTHARAMPADSEIELEGSLPEK